jgi:phage gp46-like protein
MFFHFNKEAKIFDISFDSCHWLESFAITQIFTDKKDPLNSATGWWAESLESFTVGSELFKIKRNKLTEENIELAAQSVSNALAYLQNEKAITLFDLLPEVKNNALLLNVQVLPANEPRMVNFGFHVPVD